MFNQPPSIPPTALTPPPAGPQPASNSAVKPTNNTSLIKTIIIILLALLLVGALLLAYYFSNEAKVAKADVDSQVAAIVIDREKEITDSLEAEFTKREKATTSTFLGPSDYGSLTFKYPRNWSVYVAKDAAKGGDYEAYLHPGTVPPVSATTINALRVTIKSESFENATNRYKAFVQNGSLKSSVTTVGGTDATRYDGQLLNNIIGSLVIFKIRDKTVFIQTDAEIYREDFDTILNTISFNQ